MIKIRSRVYNSQKIKLNGGVIQFVNGNAEISEELYQEIVDRKLPGIYKEGEEPEYKTNLEIELRKEVREGNKEFENEIARLKNIIEAQQIEITKKDEEIASWKQAVKDMQKGIQVSKKTETPTEENQKGLDEELYKELSALTVKELIEMGKSEAGGLFTDEDFKGKKKDEIIEMIMSKN